MLEVCTNIALCERCYLRRNIRRGPRCVSSLVVIRAPAREPIVVLLAMRWWSIEGVLFTHLELTLEPFAPHLITPPCTPIANAISLDADNVNRTIVIFSLNLYFVIGYYYIIKKIVFKIIHYYWHVKRFVVGNEKITDFDCNFEIIFSY